ncbi:unnamed protein product, partial [Meganyctiphanes norvegica]
VVHGGGANFGVCDHKENETYPGSCGENMSGNKEEELSSSAHRQELLKAQQDLDLEAGGGATDSEAGGDVDHSGEEDMEGEEGEEGAEGEEGEEGEALRPMQDIPRVY